MTNFLVISMILNLQIISNATKLRRAHCSNFNRKMQVQSLTFLSQSIDSSRLKLSHELIRTKNWEYMIAQRNQKALTVLKES